MKGRIHQWAGISITCAAAMLALGPVEAGQAEAREDLQQAQSELQQCQAKLAVYEEKLSQTFLAIIIQWSTRIHDVDLHVIDPAGKRFYYKAPTIPGRPGELSVDTRRGPGVEIWEVPEAPVGKYQVLYNFYSNEDGRDVNRAPAIVKGGVYHRDGHHRLDRRTLTRVGSDNANAVLVATVTVKDDGSVEISEP